MAGNAIVGGVPVFSNKEFPFMVSLLESAPGLGAYHSCGASLIASDVILTAAHCVEAPGVKRYVQTGRFHWKSNTDVETFSVRDTCIHPYWGIQFFAYDVALVKLDSEAEAEPIKLKQWDHHVGDEVTIMGWGLTSEFGDPSPILLETQVDIISNSQCERFYGNALTDPMMCAYHSGQDACQGDSGGPMILREKDGDYQVGITSWGEGCAESPGVYTDLSNPLVVEFINQCMCGEKGLGKEYCKDGIFYGDSATSDEITITDTEETIMYPPTSSEENACQNTNQSFANLFGYGTMTCDNVAVTSWWSCIFYYDKCPEVCCPDSCHPNLGCV